MSSPPMAQRPPPHRQLAALTVMKPLHPRHSPQPQPVPMQQTLLVGFHFPGRALDQLRSRHRPGPLAHFPTLTGRLAQTLGQNPRIHRLKLGRPHRFVPLLQELTGLWPLPLGHQTPHPQSGQQPAKTYPLGHLARPFQLPEPQLRALRLPLVDLPAPRFENPIQHLHLRSR